MAQFYGNDQIERLKNSVDIVNVIESYIPLKRTGTLYKACCPFHEEDTPSFAVYPDDQRYHCFGGTCGKGGDVLHFIMEIDKLSFPEAVELLADRAGFTLVAEKGSSSAVPRSRKKELYAANAFAMEHFKKALDLPAGSAARKYLTSRGINAEMIATFNIGYADNTLVQAAVKKGMDIEPFTKAGLAAPSTYNSSFYDKFRERLMFPIKDIQGRITGFGGRILDSSGNNKYINSPATEIFNKRENLYGIELIREIRSDHFPIVVVEGYTDVIGLYQAGFKGAVATLGTALTPEHLRHLKRFTDEVIMLFDADQAGVNAAEKTIDLFVTEDFDVAFVTLPDKLDPFEFVSNRGLEAFQHELESPYSMYAFKKRVLEHRFPEDSVNTRTRIIEQLVKTFTPIPSPVRRDLILRTISKDFDVSLDALQNMIQASSRPASEHAKPEAPQRKLDDRLKAAERNVMLTVIRFPELFVDTCDQLAPRHFQSPRYRSLFEQAIALLDAEDSFNPGRLINQLTDPDLAGEVAQFMYEYQDLEQERAELLNHDSIRCIRLAELEHQVKTLQEDYTSAERNDDPRAGELLRKLTDIQKEIQKQKHAMV